MQDESFIDEILADGQKLLNELETPKDLHEKLSSVQVTALDLINPPAVAWQMLNKNGEFDSLGHCGDFSVIIGKAKSRKSFLINIALCAAVTDEPALGIIKSQLNGRPVLYFDTEQSTYYVQLAIKRVCKATGIENPSNLKIYALRKFTPAERLELIEYAIYNTPNLGFVIIDGIKDLITSINDEVQATMIASKLLRWTTEVNCHVVSVLHQNKSDTNARGHIGSELTNKAETVLSVSKSEKDNEISIVEPQQTRNKEPESFAFEIVDGMPVLVKNWKLRTESTESKIDVSELERYKLYQMLIRIYESGDAFGYSELQIQIKLAFKEVFNKSIGDNLAKSIIGQCKNNNWLRQNGNRSPYKLQPFEPDENNLNTSV